MKRAVLGGVSAVILTAASSMSMAAEKVNIGAPAWTGAQAIAHLIQEVVETRIGGEANLVPGNNASIFQAMDQGRGDIDVHPDVWLPNQESFTKKYVDGAGTVVLSDKYYEGKQSFCVTKDFAEKNGVTSIFDLARPEVAGLMDSDGNGKGEIWIGAPGWASANVNEIKVRDYGLLPFMEPIRADQAVMTATVGDSIRKNVGYAFYCYSPHAIWFQYDIVRLEEPAFDPANYIALQPSDDPDWYEKSKVMTEDALKKVQIAYSKSLRERSPAIADLLANIQLDGDTVSSFAFEIEGGKDPSLVAKEWVAANSERVDGWLGL
jgi:glycine betaine/proline transport system substrate-binding protein